MTAAARMLWTLSGWLSWLCASLCVAIIYVMLGLLAAQVFLRYFFGAPPSWTEEVAISLFAWLVLLYATVGVRDRFHVAVDVLPIGEGWFSRVVIGRLVSLLILCFGLVLAYSGWGYVVRTAGQRSAALQYPIDLLYLSAPVCGVLLVVHAVALLLVPEPPATIAGRAADE